MQLSVTGPLQSARSAMLGSCSSSFTALSTAFSFLECSSCMLASSWARAAAAAAKAATSPGAARGEVDAGCVPWPPEDCCPPDDVVPVPDEVLEEVEADELLAGVVLPVDAEEEDVDAVVVDGNAEAVVVVPDTGLVTLAVVGLVAIVTTGALADGCNDVAKLVTLVGVAVVPTVVEDAVVVLERLVLAIVAAADVADVTAAMIATGWAATSVSEPF